jgi:hypothetical protein
MGEKLTLIKGVEKGMGGNPHYFEFPCIVLERQVSKKQVAAYQFRFNKAASNMIGVHTSCLIFTTAESSDESKITGLALWFTEAVSNRREGIYKIIKDKDGCGFRISLTGLAESLNLAGRFSALEAKALLIQEPIQDDDKMLYKVMFEKSSVAY